MIGDLCPSSPPVWEMELSSMGDMVSVWSSLRAPHAGYAGTRVLCHPVVAERVEVNGRFVTLTQPG